MAKQSLSFEILLQILLFSLAFIESYPSKKVMLPRRFLFLYLFFKLQNFLGSKFLWDQKGHCFIYVPSESLDFPLD